MKELLDQLHGLLYTAQRCNEARRVHAINEARRVLAKIRELPPRVVHCGNANCTECDIAELERTVSVGAFDPADMATAAAQGFRDGQAWCSGCSPDNCMGCNIPSNTPAAEHPDTARLRFMFDCVQKDVDPYTAEATARVEKEFPTQADIKTLDHFRRVVDIARGAV